MFTKETFIDYFQQILILEKEMEKGYLHILGSIAHPEYKAIFKRLANEERFHQSKVQELIDLFQK
ncbi:MAG: hypothetical protein SRB1_02707 [Desulfobacteraceae bacterium Eth-SRB1]|nr:MAG: hypothetical protein SRB1_02707 [Desulfobacteraceae bacterium Eth-SRB1]